MLIVVSPAKRLDFESSWDNLETSQPVFLDRTKKLVAELKKLSATDLKSLMGISDTLAELNKERFQSFRFPFTEKNSRPAGIAFKGDVYQGLQFETFKKSEINYAQKHLRILSGLYGILRPLDLIQPYRLEMGTKFSFEKNKDLYQLWHEEVTARLNEELKGQKALVNLASQEYFGAVDAKAINKEIISPVFKENKNGKLKIISFNAKKARGLMSKFLIQNKIKDPIEIKEFNLDSYKYNAKGSTPSQPLFTRDNL